MVSSPGRAAGIFAAVAALLVGAAYVEFGTELAGGVDLLKLLVAVGTTGAVLAAWRANRPRGVAALALVVGLVAFAFGVHGGVVSCNAMEYSSSADYGVEYDWGANELRFGENHDGTNYRCHGTPIRGVAVVGYVLTSVGAVGLLDGR